MRENCVAEEVVCGFCGFVSCGLGMGWVFEVRGEGADELAGLPVGVEGDVDWHFGEDADQLCVMRYAAWWMVDGFV